MKFLEAHSCVFEGKRFAHIVLRHQKHLVSVLITDSDLPSAGDNAITSQTDGNLQVTRFQTKYHAVFVISDMTASENLTVAQIINSKVQQHIKKFEV